MKMSVWKEVEMHLEMNELFQTAFIEFNSRCVRVFVCAFGGLLNQ